MSLFLIELKIKTALELEESISNKVTALVPADRAHLIHEDLIRLSGVLREIINRPKEEEDRG